MQVNRTFGRLTLVLLSVSLAFVFCFSPIGRSWEKITYDLLFYLRNKQNPCDKIAIVAIDEQSLGAIGKQWPWPRSLHGQLIDKIFQAGAKTIAFDVLFTEPQSEEEDFALAEAIKQNKNVILAGDRHIVNQGSYQLIQDIQPISELISAGAKVGQIGLSTDSDGFIREVNLTDNYSELFSFVATANYLEHSYEVLKPEQSLRINYLGEPRTIQTVFYYQALNAKSDLPADFFKDKLVFVGIETQGAASAEDIAPDHYATPFTRWGYGYMAGVEIHANIACSILQQKLIKVAPGNLLILAGVILGFISGLIFTKFRLIGGGIVFLLIVIVIYTSSRYLFDNSNYYLEQPLLLLPVLFCYISSPIYHYLQSHKDRAFIKRAFSTYVSPKLVNQLINDPSQLKLGGTKVKATVVFLDLAGFTEFSEKLSAEALVDLLNRNLGALAKIVFNWDGMIDKYIGDSVMAVWGVPVYQEDHASNACLAVLEICRTLKELADNEYKITGVKISARIAINSGEMIAGNIGGGESFNYTVLGNEVNLCSRLEGVNKIYGTKVILGENTAKLLGPEFLIRELDLVQVVGQAKPVRIFELQENSQPATKKINQLFAEAKILYYEKKFLLALNKFNQILEDFPEDEPSMVFKTRCETYISQPPDPNWDGVFRMKSK